MAASHHQRLSTGETNISSSSNNHNVDSISSSYAMLHGFNPTPSPPPYMHQGGAPLFEFGELEQAIVLQGVKIGHHHDTKQPLYTTTVSATGRGEGGGRPAATATLEMFPSWPIKFQHHPNRTSSKSGGGGGETSTTEDSGSALNAAALSTTSSKANTNNNNNNNNATNTHLVEPESPAAISSRRNPNQPSSSSSLFNHHHHSNIQQQHRDIMGGSHHHQHHDHSFSSRGASVGGGGAGPSSSSQNQHLHQHRQQQSTSTNNNSKLPLEKRGPGVSRSEKALDAKTLRRLAQNREAARKSRLRKKAYVQQLETSRIKLAQLEQDLQRARAQGLFLGGGVGVVPTNISSGAAIFDMEYSRWLEDDQRYMSELRTGLQANLSDGDLRMLVDGCISHHDEIFRLKGVAAKADVFHLVTGMWTTPAERCFLWMGGFKPSDLIKMLKAQLDPLTEQQDMGIYSLQQSSQQAEEALWQGFEQLQASLVDTIAGHTVTDGMHQMAIALGKLANLEGFVRQADNLRQQTLHQLCRILTVRQAARCFLMIGEYYGRMRALSSLWASRPRDQSTMMGEDNTVCQTPTDWQMVQSSQNHFAPF